MNKKILIVNDDNHDDEYCFEDKTKFCAESAVKFLALPHTENYEVKLAYIFDIEEIFQEKHFDFTSRECFDIVYNMFENVILDNDNYIDSFNELWEMAK